jgi:hypothetical protein
MSDLKDFIHNLVVDGNDKEEDFIPRPTWKIIDFAMANLM